MSIKITKDNYVYKMDKLNKVVQEVSVEDVVDFETFDCFQNQIQTDGCVLEELDFSSVNPVTGPIYIKEAKVGDILAVKIEKIKLADKGVLASSNLLGTLKDKLETSELMIIPIDNENNTAKIDENITIKLNPMIGVIGVAPTDEGIISGAPDYHGGNMDTKEITEGSTVFFKVNVDGALFGLGDLHAAMGDGEISGTGIEVEAVVTTSFKLFKDGSLPTPAVKLSSNTHHNTDKIAFLFSHENLDIAADEVTNQCHEFLVNVLEMDKNLAVRYMSVAGDLGVSQIVDPKKTAKFTLDLKPLRGLNKDLFNKFEI